jgi:hypothetical protein
VVRVFRVVREGYECFRVLSGVVGLLESVPLGVGVLGE